MVAWIRFGAPPRVTEELRGRAVAPSKRVVYLMLFVRNVQDMTIYTLAH